MADMKTIMGRAAEPQEIIDVVLFVASDKASYLTGENILVDGGRLITRIKE
jgi:NAD(P)-dependent dehydrogenase (short-subunit alcohol dehydrogenase family)